MSQQALLKKIVELLDARGIAYMATGSIVSSLQGEPRATHDIDLLVELRPSSISDLLKAFPPPDYYFDPEAARIAINRRDMFNLLEIQTGDKVDFWSTTDDPFDQSRFSRRLWTGVFGIRLAVSSPEDTILQKLRWAELSGGSERQFGDALRVYEVQHGNLDQTYLRLWSGRLGLGDLWNRLLREAKPE